MFPPIRPYEHAVLQLGGDAPATVDDGKPGRVAILSHFQANPLFSGLIHYRIESILQEIQQNLPDLNLAAEHRQAGIVRLVLTSVL